MPKDSRLYMTFPIDFPEHPKVKPLSPESKWAFVEMNAYSRRLGLDGVIPVPVALTMWAIELLGELVGSHPKRPLVVLRKGNYILRDYAQHQFTTADLADLHEKRSRAGSAGGKAKASATASATANAKQDPQQIAAESESGLRTDLTTLNQSSQVPNSPEIDLTKIVAAVQRSCGRDCSKGDAFLIVGTVMSRAKTKPKNQTAFVVRAIENEPFVWQKLLDEQVAS